MYQMLFVWGFILPSLGCTFHFMSYNVWKGILVRQGFHTSRKFKLPVNFRFPQLNQAPKTCPFLAILCFFPQNFRLK